MQIIFLGQFSSVIASQLGFPGGSDGKEPACSAGDLGSIPGSGRSPGGGNGHPLQYSWLEDPMDRRAWRVMVRGVAESDMTEQPTLSLWIKPGQDILQAGQWKSQGMGVWCVSLCVREAQVGR